MIGLEFASPRVYYLTLEGKLPEVSAKNVPYENRAVLAEWCYGATAGRTHFGANFYRVTVLDPSSQATPW